MKRAALLRFNRCLPRPLSSANSKIVTRYLHSSRGDQSHHDRQNNDRSFRFGLATLGAGALLGGSGQLKCEVKPKKKSASDLFAEMDKNQDGVITREEWDAQMLKGPSPGEELILSADCGGTTTRLMLFAVNPKEEIERKKNAPGKLLFERKYPNILFKSFYDIVNCFLDDSIEVVGDRCTPRVAVFAMAGVVSKNSCRFTNLDWVVCGEELGRTFGIDRVEIVNDFVAQGYGVLTLGDHEVDRLNNVEPEDGGIIACVGAGTGLGVCYLSVGRTGHYKAWPSEMGHVEFAPRGHGSKDVQIALLKHLKIRLSGWSRVSIERVVSGRGICNVYDFLAYHYPDRVNKRVHDEFMTRPHDASIITMNAWPGSLCEEALQIFAACYGGFCGSVSIGLIPNAGLFLTGGVTQKLKDWMIRDGSFMEAYEDKGRVSPLLNNVPLFMVKGEDMGQRGAHLRAVMLLRQHLEGLQPRAVGRAEELVPPRQLDTDAMSVEIAKLIEEYQVEVLRQQQAKRP